MFQSLPDSWAIDQLFPIMPIHRLNEKPTRRAVLADITCDSDGKIDHFIDKRDVKDALELHPLNNDDYYLGIFLVGAYQEILGDLHNLFGDTHAVQVSLAPNGGYLIDHVVEGDTVTEVLNYVSYNKDDLVAKLRKFTEVALRNGPADAGRVAPAAAPVRGGLVRLHVPGARGGCLVRGRARAATAPRGAGWDHGLRQGAGAPHRHLISSDT